MLSADSSISTQHDPLPSSCHSEKMLWNPSICCSHTWPSVKILDCHFAAWLPERIAKRLFTVRLGCISIINHFLQAHFALDWIIYERMRSDSNPSLVDYMGSRARSRNASFIGLHAQLLSLAVQKAGGRPGPIYHLMCAATVVT